jgi:phosphopantetheinyl transferase (holo-ACP synthase)
VARENVEVVIYNHLGIEAGRFSTKEACFGALYTIENKQSGVYFVKIKDASGKIKERKLVIQ